MVMSSGAVRVAYERILRFLCFVLAAYPKAPPASAVKCVVALRSAALGDFILSVPALAVVARLFPHAERVFFTVASTSVGQKKLISRYVDARAGFPWLQLGVPHLFDRSVQIQSPITLGELCRLRGAFDVNKPNVALVLVDPCAPWLGRLKKILLLRMLFGWIPIVGWRGNGSLWEDPAKLKDRGYLRHHVWGPLQFVFELPEGAAFADSAPVFDVRPTPSEKAKAQQFIEEFPVAPKVLVALAPGSIQPHKRWPIERFIEFAREFDSAVRDVSFVVLGAPGDEVLGNQIAAALERPVLVVAGRASIGVSAALLERSDLLVGNDGGAMHLGDAMGAKVISIVPGIEYPNSIEPWNNASRAVRIEIECSPCYDFVKCPLGHNKCMLQIPVSEVLRKAIEALRE